VTPSILASLPTHPLLVHVPVVLVPLAAIGALAMAIRPAWFERFGVAVAGLAGAGFVGAVLAAQSGESLQEHFQSVGQTISPTLRHHAELGDSVQGISLLFFGLVAAWVLFAWWRRRAGEEKAIAKVRRPRLVASVLMALAVLAGAAATTAITVTGHNGAKSVWESKP
jgi:uncharacterized membrane protein